MSGSTRTERSKPSPPTPSSEDVIELVPPAHLGFNGTAKFDTHDPASMKIVDELRRRGYTDVP